MIVGAGFTTCGTCESLPLLATKLTLPEYAAVIVCVPTASDDVTNVAVTEVFSAVCPMGVPASLKATVPVGTPAPGATALTVAVNTTGWPHTDGFGVKETTTEV